MTIENTLSDIRNRLAQQVFLQRDDVPKFKPSNYDPYIAASVLQKAIRRGDETFALGATARLLETDPKRLWRRLLVIAFEDVGVGDLDIVGKVTAVSGQKRWRGAHGGEWPIAALLVRDLCRAVKDRTADDVLHIAENSPDLRDHRRCWSAAPIDKLTAFIQDSEASLPERALAVWFGVGTDRYRSDELRPRAGFSEQVFTAYQKMGVPEDVLAIAWTGHRKMSWPLAAFLPLIWHAAQTREHHVKSDVFPPYIMIGDTPSYALDAFTRGGKAAIRELIKESVSLGAFLESHAPKPMWQKVVAILLFRIEGGLMTNRLRWDEGNKVREDDDLIVPGLTTENVPAGLQVMRDQLPLLNNIRGRIGVPNFR